DFTLVGVDDDDLAALLAADVELGGMNGGGAGEGAGQGGGEDGDREHPGKAGHNRMITAGFAEGRRVFGAPSGRFPALCSPGYRRRIAAMKWETPAFVEINMSAEIGGYGSDFTDRDPWAPAAPHAESAGQTERAATDAARR